jgi:hypothetical protein
MSRFVIASERPDTVTGVGGFIRLLLPCGGGIGLCRDAMTGDRKRLGKDLLSNRLERCQRFLLPRSLQRYERGIRPRLLKRL